MSLPKFPSSSEIISREEAITAIITSIAMEETALSRIINAEADKIQYTLAYVTANTTNNSIKQILEVNQSVESLLSTINEMQILLKNKLRIAASIVPCTFAPPDPDLPVNPVPPTRPCPQPCEPPVPPPDNICAPNPCAAFYAAETRYCWYCGKTLYFNAQTQDGSHIARQILLERGQKYRIKLNLSFLNKGSDAVRVGVSLCYGSETFQYRELNGNKGRARLSDDFIWETQGKYKKYMLAVTLLSPEKVSISYGELQIINITD